MIIKFYKKLRENWFELFDLISRMIFLLFRSYRISIRWWMIRRLVLCMKGQEWLPVNISRKDWYSSDSPDPVICKIYKVSYSCISRIKISIDKKLAEEISKIVTDITQK